LYKFQITSCAWYTKLLRSMFYLRSATGHRNKEFGVLKLVTIHTRILVSD